MKKINSWIEKQQEKIKKRIESLDNTYIINNKYMGKKRSHICKAPKTTIIAMVIFPLLLLFNLVPHFNYLILTIIVEIMAISNLLSQRIKVGPQGIKYHHQFFKWEQIETIGISVNKNGRPNRVYRKFIYISKHKHDKPVNLFHYRTAVNYRDYKNVQRITVAEEIPSYLIIASFNRRLIHHIIAYWGTDIKNLENTVGWYSYIKFYNFIHRNMKH